MFKPTRCNVVFIPVETANVSKGGIIAPESYRETNKHDAQEVKAAKRAKVVAVGPGRMTPSGYREVCCKIGDYIQLSGNAYIQQFTLNGETTYVVDDDYIVGILDETDVISQAAPEKNRIQVLS